MLWCHTKAATWPTFQTPWLPACFSPPLTCSCGDRIHLLQPRPVIHCLAASLHSSVSGAPGPQLLTPLPRHFPHLQGMQRDQRCFHAQSSLNSSVFVPTADQLCEHRPPAQGPRVRVATGNASPFILGFPNMD